MRKITCFTFCFFVFYGCQKSTSSLPQTNDLPVLKSENECSATWAGEFGDNNNPPDITTLSASIFIHNGYAQLPYANDPYGIPYYTNINLAIPSCTSINGDSLKFQASVENADSTAGAQYGNDVDLYIFGTLNTAHVTFNAAEPQYTSFQVGNIGVTNSTSLIQSFDNFQLVKIISKNNHLSLFLNNVLLEKINYSGIKIGNVTKLLVGFKGSGKVNQVILANSFSEQKIFVSNFNTVSQATVNF